MSQTSTHFDLIVIGSGPAGYVGAIRASQLGLKVGLIEKERLGGVCLNIGCIPSKSLIHQAQVFDSMKELEKMGVMIDRSEFRYEKVFRQSRVASDKLSKGVQFLMKKNGIQVFSSEARFLDPKKVQLNDGTTLYANKFLIATGSSPRALKSFEVDEQTILTSTGALMLDHLPKSMLVIGSGAIGMELGDVFHTFGTSVMIMEILPSILPTEDNEIASFVHKSFTKKGIRILTGAKALSCKKLNEDGKAWAEVIIENADGEQDTLSFEKVLIAVGRVPNSQNLGLEELGISIQNGFIETGDYYQTSIPHIYAAGDVIGPPLLAHLASKEAEIAVEHMAGHPTIRRVDPDTVPGAIYSEPQVASFGKTEAALEKEGLAYSKFVFPFRGIGKAVAIGKPEGMVKLLADPESRKLLGAHIAGEQATELIHQLLLAKTNDLGVEAVAQMIHAHPTISEGIMEACRGIDGWAIHV